MQIYIFSNYYHLLSVRFELTCMSLVLSNKGKGMQSSSEQPLVGEERYVTTRITATKKPLSSQKNPFEPNKPFRASFIGILGMRMRSVLVCLPHEQEERKNSQL